jgi:outer membrane protein OmpA-like peptidoglycan-associated protein
VDLRTTGRRRSGDVRLCHEGLGQRPDGPEGSADRSALRTHGRGEVGDGARIAKTRAEAAHTRAEAAFGRADEVNTRLSRLWNARHKRDLVETLHVQFGFDRADLSDGAQTALLAITKELKENPLLSVDLEGYTDQSGPREYNVGLSQRRVESVRRFLVGNGADLARIYSVGLGPLQAKTEQAALQRRVTVRLMINPTD